MATNPRYKNGNHRRKMRARFKAMGLPCHICGRPIHYDEPSDYQHPWSFVIDEKIPISKYKEFGYESPEAACLDKNNLFPAHYACNHRKSDRLMGELSNTRTIKHYESVSDGEW